VNPLKPLEPRPASGRSVSRRGLLSALVALVGSGWLGTGTARAAPESDPFLVIVNSRNPLRSVPREFLEGAFLKKVSRWDDGEAIRPVDQGPALRARGSFSRLVLKRSVAAVKSYWLQRIFAGRDTPPPELDSDEAVIRYVRTHHGAVGYVSADRNLDGTKTLTIR